MTKRVYYGHVLSTALPVDLRSAYVVITCCQCSRLGALEEGRAVAWCVLMLRSPRLESTWSTTQPAKALSPYGHSAPYSAMTTYISENFRFPTLNVLSRLSRTSPFS